MNGIAKVSRADSLEYKTDYYRASYVCVNGKHIKIQPHRFWENRVLRPCDGRCATWSSVIDSATADTAKAITLLGDPDDKVAWDHVRALIENLSK